MKTGQTVDLISFGSANGMEVKEISDLYEGYEFLTGDKIQRSTPVAEGEMEPAMQTNELLKVKTASWKSRIDREIASLKEEAKRSGGAVKAASGLIDEADKSFAKAQRFEKNGFFGAALEAYVQTALSVSAATRFTKALYQMVNNQVDTLLDSMMAAAKIRDEVDAFGAQLEIKAKTKTRGGQVSSTSAFTNYASARAAVMIGDDFRQTALSLLEAMKAGKVKITGETLKILMLKTVTPIVYYDASRIYLDYVKDAQDLIGEEGSALPLAAPIVDRTVSGYASASAAVLEYFDALIVDQVANDEHIAKDEAKAFIANKETDYYLALKENAIALAKPEGAGSGSDGFKLMKLGAASESFLLGGKLVNKYYSLGGRFDKDGNFVLENRRALSGQIELARSNAREAAARAKAGAGFIPSPARLAYQMGNAEREGNDEEKLEALTAYWMSAFWSELAAQK
jgi:DNA-binding transcriptional MerR regulator